MLNKTLIVGIMLLAIVSWCFVLSSCNEKAKALDPKPLPELPNVQPQAHDIGDAAKGVGDTGADVTKRSDKIDDHAAAISNNTPPEAKPKIDPDLQGIKNETKGLRQDSATLAAIQQKLVDAQGQLTEQQKKINGYTEFAKNSELERTKLQSKIKELQESNSKLLKTMLAWITVICVVGIGASLVIGFFFKTPAAFMVAAGCVATLGVAVAVTMYMQYIAWAALALLGLVFLGAVGYVVWQIHNRNKAVTELVKTNEVSKQNMPLANRQKVYGNGAEPGLVEHLQSPATKNLVATVRSKAKSGKSFNLAPEIPKFWQPTAGDMPAQVDPYVVTSTPIVISSPSKNIFG